MSRLVGMETEYSTIVADEEAIEYEDLPPARMVYEQICAAIRRDQPAVRGLVESGQLFLASGGAVTFESHPSSRDQPGGLIEIATPEVRSVSELLACQRSIDELVSESAADSETSFDLRVLKSSSDAFGHVFGCQENYEAEVASGLMLLIYRVSVCLLWLVQIVAWAVSLPIILIVMVAVLMGRRRRSATQRKGNLSPHQEPLFNLDDQPDSELRFEPEVPADHETLTESDEFYKDVPSWLAKLVIFALRIIHSPTAIILTFVAKHIAFRKQRKYLAALLVSRIALSGTGHLQSNGCYLVSAKAMAINAVSHLGGFRSERPIFVFGHWLSQLSARSFHSLSSTRTLLTRRQRLQIGLSDSSLSDLAEYVKVGSVSLVLDLIESGHRHSLPVLKNPIASLHRIASDWNLVARADTDRGELSAIQIQKEYLKAAKEFVEQTDPDKRGESELLLFRWQEILDAAAAYRKDASDVHLAIGRIDWLTKRHLIDALPTDASWSDRKKIDLRYHELSGDGYYHQVIRSKPDLRIATEDLIELRRRSPPSGSPAAKRSWAIREFSCGDAVMQSDWTHAIVSDGSQRRRIEFTGQAK